MITEAPLNTDAFSAKISSLSVSSDDPYFVINGDETWTNVNYSGTVYIPKNSTLTTTGNTLISGDVYVFGTLNYYDTLTISGTLYCLNYKLGSISMSAGNYNFGYVNPYGKITATNLVVKATFLNTEIPLPEPSNEPTVQPSDEPLNPSIISPPAVSVSDAAISLIEEYKTYQNTLSNSKPLTKNIKLRKIKFKKEKYSLKKGKRIKLKIFLSPSSFKGRIKYKSTKKKIASVSKNGIVKAKKNGLCFIVASYKKINARTKIKVK